MFTFPANSSEIVKRFGSHAQTPGRVAVDFNRDYLVIHSVRAFSNRVFACGEASDNATGGFYDAFIAAFDAETGALARFPSTPDGWIQLGGRVSVSTDSSDPPVISTSVSARVLDIAMIGEQIWSLVEFIHSGRPELKLESFDADSGEKLNSETIIWAKSGIHSRARLLCIGGDVLVSGSITGEGTYISRHDGSSGAAGTTFGNDGVCVIPEHGLIDLLLDSSNRIIVLARREAAGGGAEVVLRRINPSMYNGSGRSSPDAEHGHADSSFQPVVDDGDVQPRLGTLLASSVGYVAGVRSTIALVDRTGTTMHRRVHPSLSELTLASKANGRFFGSAVRLGQASSVEVSIYTSDGDKDDTVEGIEKMGPMIDPVAIANGVQKVYIGAHSLSKSYPAGVPERPDQIGWIVAISDPPPPGGIRIIPYKIQETMRRAVQILRRRRERLN